MSDAPAGAPRFLRLPAAAPPGLLRAVAMRLLTNLGLRLTFPFLPAIAREFDASIDTTGRWLGAADVSGLLGPVLGGAADRRGHRAAMRVGALVFGVGALVMGGAPALWAFALGAVLVQVGKLSTDAALSAWVAERVAFADRGRVTALVESSWPLSLMLGAPVAGVLVATLGVRSLFLVLGAVVLVLNNRVVPPPDAVGRRAAGLVVPPPEIGVVDGDGGGAGAAGAAARASAGQIVAVLGTMGLLGFGMQCGVAVSGAWLEDVAEFSAGVIGVVVVAFAAAELAGTALTAWLADRVGKARSVLLGALVALAGLLLLAAAPEATVAGLAGYAVLTLGFEQALISLFPLVTELAPQDRGRLVGLSFAVLTITRASGTVVATSVYGGGGLGRAASIGLVAMVAGVVLTAAVVREPSSSAVRA